MDYTWQYYDLVLAGIAASLAAGVAVGYATAASLVVSVPAFAVGAILIMGHAMFVNGPVDEPADLTEEVDALN